MAPLFLNIESTSYDLRSEIVYIAKKIDILRTISEAPGGFKTTIARLKQEPRYAQHPDVDVEPRLVLLFASNQSEDLPSAAALASLLRTVGGPFLGAHVDYHCVDSPGGRGLLVTLPNRQQVHIGLLTGVQLSELAYLGIAMRKAKRHSELDERFLAELTERAGMTLYLEPIPLNLRVEAPTLGQNISVEECPVTFQKFTVDPLSFLRLGTVLRLVRDMDYVQRLPLGSHLEAMADEVERGGRFPTPLLAVVPEQARIDSAQAQIVTFAGGPLSLYSWHIVDGQHRLFCYYFVQRGGHPETIDVNAYSIANLGKTALVSSGLFLKVNYEAVRPPIELALTHYAHQARWRRGVWISRSRRGNAQDVDTKLYSSRILATRLLAEMNLTSTIYGNFFKMGGSQDKGKTSLQSISTYLATGFENRDPSDGRNPLAREYGSIATPPGPWTLADPSPEHMLTSFDLLVRDFDAFWSTSFPVISAGVGWDAKDMLRTWTFKNNNVFVALWRVFYRYRLFLDRPSGARYRWPVDPNRTAAAILTLMRLASSNPPLLFGASNDFRSGSGVDRLTSALVADFDGAAPLGAQKLSTSSPV